MYAIEFTTKIENGTIKIPKSYQSLQNQNVQIFVIPINKKKEHFNPRQFFGIASVSKPEIDDYLQSSRKDWDDYLDV